MHVLMPVVKIRGMYMKNGEIVVVLRPKSSKNVFWNGKIARLSSTNFENVENMNFDAKTPKINGVPPSESEKSVPKFVRQKKEFIR